MTSRPSVDLHDTATRGLDAAGVVEGCLVALDNVEIELAPQVGQGAFEQRGLAGARGADQVERQNPSSGEPAAISLRQTIVLGENLDIQVNHARIVMMMIVVVMMIVVMRMSV